MNRTRKRLNVGEKVSEVRESGKSHRINKRCIALRQLTYLNQILLFHFIALALCFFFAAHAQAQVRRLVVVQADGLSQDVIDRFVAERDAQTGKSALPWIKYVFYERGARLQNFYTRGITVSAPAWAIINTGQHAQIKGNVEFDRFTMRPYDYTNFYYFYINYSLSRQVDMPGPTLLDDVGLPMVQDAFSFDERFTTPELYQRAVSWHFMYRSGYRRITSRSPRELLDELSVGFDNRSILIDEAQRELNEKLNDPTINYFDIFTPEIDHVMHLNRDRASQLLAVQELDAIIGRLWTAIERSPRAAETAMILVSDHGLNSDPRIYSQGFSLVNLLGSAEGGAHHIIMRQRALGEYALRGSYTVAPPFDLIVTPSENSFYLKDESKNYPTAALDLDGNERASIHLRDSDLNELQILLQQLKRDDLAPDLRRAVTDELFSVIERRRAAWQQTLVELKEELGALRKFSEEERASAKALEKTRVEPQHKWETAIETRRRLVRADQAADDEKNYSNYLRILENLLALKRETFDAKSLKIEDLIAPRALGEQNTIHQLQNYIVGLAAQGLRLSSDGKSLDVENSFRRINYFDLLTSRKVRNNVQPGVGNRPIDLVGAHVPAEILEKSFPNERIDDAAFIYESRTSQALILGREDEKGNLQLRYVPVENLTQDRDGALHFTRAKLRENFPLKIYEDPKLALPADATDRNAWLLDWHTDSEWLRALHQTKYSNGLVGLYEHFARHTSPALAPDAPGLALDERLMNRLRRRQRELVEADLTAFASDHWNFNVVGFNPGGNHGSFLRASTHAALMFVGGARTGIPHGLKIEEPYDDLSYAPTVFALCGLLDENGALSERLRQLGFSPFLSPPISEIITQHPTAAGQNKR